MTKIDNGDYFEDLACHAMLLADALVKTCVEPLPTKEAVVSAGERLLLIAEALKACGREMSEGGTFFLSRQN